MPDIILSYDQRPISFAKAERYTYGGETYAVRKLGTDKVAWCNAVFICNPSGINGPVQRGQRAYSEAWTATPDDYIGQWRLVMDTGFMAMHKTHAQLTGWSENQAIREHLGLPLLGPGCLHKISQLHCGVNSFGVGGDILSLRECEALAFDWSERDRADAARRAARQ